MSFAKTYIGKGKKVDNLNIVRVTLNVSDLEKFIYLYEGQRLITFELAQLQKPDNYGKTHTAYVSEKQEEPAVEAPKEVPAKKSRRKKAA